MVKAMKLDLKRHSIIWNLEKLEVYIDEIEHEYEKAKGKIAQDLTQRITELLLKNRKYSKLLKTEGD
jgi:hypothetical protein